MNEVNNTNYNDADFDPNINNKLQCYVYLLRDPRNQNIFYVGKGGGSGDGNQRVLEHFKEAETALMNFQLPRSQKIQRIIDIWSCDERVEWFVVRHGLDEYTALHVEAALIDGFSVSQNGPTLNAIRGHGAPNNGILHSDMVYSFMAEKVNPQSKHNCVFIFPIHNALIKGRSEYNSTRSYWDVSNRLREFNNALAVGIENGTSKGVFTIDQWSNNNLPKGKWEFTSSNPYHLSNHTLNNKNFQDIINKSIEYWQRGNYLVVEFDGKGKFRFIRGHADKIHWFLL
jgi:hypothetical protein